MVAHLNQPIRNFPIMGAIFEEREGKMKSFSLINLVKSYPLDLNPLTTKFESGAKIDSNYQLNDITGIKILENMHE